MERVLYQTCCEVKSDENGKGATGFGIRELTGEVDKGSFSGDEGGGVRK